MGWGEGKRSREDPGVLVRRADGADRADRADRAGLLTLIDRRTSI